MVICRFSREPKNSLIAIVLQSVCRGRIGMEKSIQIAPSIVDNRMPVRSHLSILKNMAKAYLAQRA